MCPSLTICMNMALSGGEWHSISPINMTYKSLFPQKYCSFLSKYLNNYVWEVSDQLSSVNFFLKHLILVFIFFPGIKCLLVLYFFFPKQFPLHEAFLRKSIKILLG